MLPDVRPDGTDRPSDQVCHERQVLFPVPTPPGFWSRLLARVMHTVQCLRNLIETSHGRVTNEVVKSRSDLCTSLPLRHTWAGASGNKVKNERISSPPNVLLHASSLPEDAVQSLECSQSVDGEPTSEDAEQQGDEVKPSFFQPKVAVPASLPVIKAGDAVFKYWRSGFNYCDPELYFLVEDLEKENDVAEVHGVQIVVSPGREGCKVYGQLIDHVSNLVEEWYPGLLCPQTAEQGLEQRSVCYQCLTEGFSDPHVFSKESLVKYIKDSTACVPCPKGHEVSLVDLTLTKAFS